MITPSSSTVFPSFTIESVHGLKETIVVGPNGIAPASKTSPSNSGSAGSRRNRQDDATRDSFDDAESGGANDSSQGS